MFHNSFRKGMRVMRSRAFVMSRQSSCSVCAALALELSCQATRAFISHRTACKLLRFICQGLVREISLDLSLTVTVTCWLYLSICDEFIIAMHAFQITSAAFKPFLFQKSWRQRFKELLKTTVIVIQYSCF